MTASINVTREGGSINLEVGTAQVAEVLTVLANKAGLTLQMRGDLGKTRPQAFEGVPVEQAIRRLVGDNRVNLLFRYDTDPDGAQRLIGVVARGAAEVPPDVLTEWRMRSELRRVRVPPPPPPPPPAQ